MLLISINISIRLLIPSNNPTHTEYAMCSGLEILWDSKTSPQDSLLPFLTLEYWKVRSRSINLYKYSENWCNILRHSCLFRYYGCHSRCTRNFNFNLIYLYINYLRASEYTIPLYLVLGKGSLLFLYCNSFLCTRMYLEGKALLRYFLFRFPKGINVFHFLFQKMVKLNLSIYLLKCKRKYCWHRIICNNYLHQGNIRFGCSTKRFVL